MIGGELTHILLSLGKRSVRRVFRRHSAGRVSGDRRVQGTRARRTEKSTISFVPLENRLPSLDTIDNRTYSPGGMRLLSELRGVLLQPSRSCPSDVRPTVRLSRVLLPSCSRVPVRRDLDSFRVFHQLAIIFGRYVYIENVKKRFFTVQFSTQPQPRLQRAIAGVGNLWRDRRGVFRLNTQGCSPLMLAEDRRIRQTINRFPGMKMCRAFIAKNVFQFFSLRKRLRNTAVVDYITEKSPCNRNNWNESASVVCSELKWRNSPTRGKLGNKNKSNLPSDGSRTQFYGRFFLSITATSIGNPLRDSTRKLVSFVIWFLNYNR